VRLTRRQALAGAAAAAAFPDTALAEDKKAMNRAALSSSLAAKQTAVIAYEAIANGTLLGRSVESTFRSFLAQEKEHAMALGDALEQMGAQQPTPPRRDEIPGLGSLRTQRQAIGFALGLERRALATYYKAAGELKDANALKTLASIMNCDGQHASVLRQLAGRPGVPRAFETGQA
jgi:rubrerythrin